MFVLSGPKWGNPTYGTSSDQIFWSFAVTNSPQNQYQYDDVISDPTFQQLVRNAFETWEAVANVDFVEVPQSASTEFLLGWDAIDGVSNTVGEAFWQSTSSDGINFSISRAEIRFDTAENWSTDPNHVGNQTNFFVVAVHEIGHALGLDHVNDPNQIMFPQLTDQITLGPGDIQGIQTLYGQSAIVSFNVTAGNDTVTLTTGDDAVDGLGGLDTAVFATSRATVTTSVNGNVITAVGQGNDTLTNFERLQFTDGTLAFDVSGNAGEAYRIYQAAFNRTPDNDGLKFWINNLDGGNSLHNVAIGFVGSQEFQTVYGANPTNLSIVQQFYRNVLGREGEEAGINFWTGELNSGARDVATVLAGFSESPENVARVGPTINDGIFYT